MASTPSSEIGIQDMIEVVFWHSERLPLINNEGNPLVDYTEYCVHVKSKGAVKRVRERERFVEVSTHNTLRGLVLRKGSIMVRETKGSHWMLKSIDTFDILTPEHGCVRVVYDPKDITRSIYKMTPESYGETNGTYAG